MNLKINEKGIVRSKGTTIGEQYLKQLGEKTFLSLWSYANLYREPGKELCDLLIVFGEHIILFSDKDCKFSNSHSSSTTSNWKKWFRKAIQQSARQLWGAERWIKKFPHRIFLDAACTKPFPYPLPEVAKAKFHLIVVAHEIARQCASFHGGSGSLMIRSDVKGFSKHDFPFTVGDLDPSRTYVHILDDTSLKILMQTRDTISDFTAYLEKKEKLMRSGKEIFAAGEEELLALYLQKTNSSGEHDFAFAKGYDAIGVMEGEWKSFQKNPQRLAQIADDAISYFWDHLIEEFGKHALQGTQEFAAPPLFSSSEKVLRFLAAEPRFVRRMLAIAFLDIIKKTPANQRMLRVIPHGSKGLFFVFLVFPYRHDRPYKVNRKVRKKYLEACCRVVKFKYSAAMDVVGIATESGRMDADGGSEDACYLDARQWTEEQNEEARQLQKDLEILVKPTSQPYHLQEYRAPESIPPQLVPVVGRNEKCPCGSGKKYKKCHGK